MTQENQEPQEIQSEEPAREEHPLAGLKVVVNVQGDSVFIGVTHGDVDPHLEAHPAAEGGIQEILTQVPQVLERARERWATVPSFPAYEAPAPPPAPARTATQGTGRRGRPAQLPNQPTVDTPRMF